MYPYNTYNESIHGISKIPTSFLVFFSSRQFRYIHKCIHTYMRSIYISEYIANTQLYKTLQRKSRLRVWFLYIFFHFVSFSLIEIYIYQQYVETLPIKIENENTSINEKIYIYVYIYTYITKYSRRMLVNYSVWHNKGT